MAAVVAHEVKELAHGTSQANQMIAEVVCSVLIVLGLFTRLASLGAIGFITLFYLCNPPFVGYFYSIPTEGSYLVVNKNLVELCALFVILTTGSGRCCSAGRSMSSPTPRAPNVLAA